MVVPGFADKTPAAGAETWPKTLKDGQKKTSVLSAVGKLVTVTVWLGCLNVLLKHYKQINRNILVSNQKIVLKNVPTTSVGNV